MRPTAGAGIIPRVPERTERLVTVVLTVSDFERSVHLYGTVFGLDLHVDDHHGDRSA